MRGSRREKSPGVYELRADAAADPLTHKRRQVSRTFRGTKRDADKALRALLLEVDQGRHGGADATVDDLLARWLAHAERDLSPTTMREYRRLLKARIAPAIGQVKLRKLTALHLDDLYAGLLDEGLSPKSVRAVHSMLRRALSMAVKWEWLPTSPAASASPPRSVRPEVTIPSSLAVKALIAKAEDLRNLELGTYLRLAAATGARRGELCGLRWSDVDLEGGSLTIRRSVATVPEGIIVKEPKTPESRRTLAIDAATVEVLAEHRARMEKRAIAGNVELAAEAQVFSADLTCTRPWHPDWVNTMFDAVRAKAGLSLRLHDLRHFHASQLLAAGVPITTVKERMGWSSFAMLSVYGHGLEEEDRKAADAIGKLLGGPASSS